MVRVLWMAMALMLLPATAAADQAAGKRKSTVCIGCHGPQGKAVNKLWPNLAGQNPGYIVAQLQAFKAGRRVSSFMQPIAMGLSDVEIRNLALYYAGLGKKCD